MPDETLHQIRNLQHTNRPQSIAFSNQSTYENDYRSYESVKRFICKWPRDRIHMQAEKARLPHVFVDHSTLLQGREETHVPFDLFLEPKPILGRNPHQRIKALEIPANVNKPTLKTSTILQPAVHISDIEDKEIKAMILRNMYLTDWRRAEIAAASPVQKRNVPETSIEAENIVQVRYKPDIHPAMPIGWQGRGKSWDEHQTRAKVDSDKAFWLNKPLKETVLPTIDSDVKEEIHSLIRQDNLNRAFDKVGPTFCGYMPNCPRGIGLRKPNLPIEHSYVSTYQAFIIRHTI